MRAKRHLPQRTNVRPGDLTVSRLPVVRCAVCGKTLAHQPGQAAKVLTEHYRKEHPKRKENPK